MRSKAIKVARPPRHGHNSAMNTVVTGASRGIGLEFARQLLMRGDAVHAAVRSPRGAPGLQRLRESHPDALHIHACDVSDDRSVRAFASSLGGEPVDVLINNAGVSGKYRSLEELDADDVLQTFRTNALGAVLVTRALLPMLRQSKIPKVIHITSRMGAIAEASGGAYAYRMSKAALNMAAKNMAEDLRADRIISVAVSPGWVQTDMGGRSAPTPVEDSVRGMLQVIDGLSLEQSGTFLDFRGQRLPW